MTAPPIEPRGIVFDIQHLSLQDGPGVRTSVFLKGCPLRCAWCHNPESFRGGAQLCYTQRLCTGCGMCAKLCPKGVHAFQREGGQVRHTVHFQQCDACGRCLRGCCYDALSLTGLKMTIEGLLEEMDPDRPYFGHDGGVTLTGGEPMMQFAFVLAFLRRKGTLGVCMETCGYAPWRQYEAVLPYVDWFLYDMKATDPQLHKALCGQDNRLILANLERLYERGARIILRLPLVPGVNDDRAHLEAVAGWLQSHPRVERAEIMPYHRMGVGKAETFGLEAAKVDLPNATEAQKQEWLEALRALGAKNVALG